MKILVDLDVTPTTAKDDPQLLGLLRQLPSSSLQEADPQSVQFEGFVPFGEKAVELTIGNPPECVQVQADDQHISLEGKLDVAKNDPVLGKLSHLLRAIQIASKNYKGAVPQGQVEEADNPFA